MITKDSNFPIPFGGGLNTTSGPLNIADNESPNCKNVCSGVSGTIQRRNGYSTLGGASMGEANTDGNGVYDYWTDENTHYLMAYIGTSLYKTDSVGGSFDGVMDAVTFGTAMSNNYMEFEQFNVSGTNYLIMATHGRDKLQKYDGTTCTDLSTDADMPKPKYIKQWMGFLFCANLSGYESRVYYNTSSGNISGSTDWSSTKFEEIRTDDGDFITGQAVLKGRLYTFKRYSIHRWTYYGGTPLFGIKTAVSGIGAVSSKSIININHPKYGDILVFLGADGRFYAFDGSNVVPISAKIENDNRVSEFNLSKINRTNATKACAVDYKEKHMYMCWAPTGTNNNWCISWDYYNDAWWPLQGINARSCGVGESGGKHLVYFMVDTGSVYVFDSGNSDGSSNISAVYDTKNFNYGNQTMLKGHRYIELQLKNIGSYSLNLQHRSDWVTSWGDAASLSMYGDGFILGDDVNGVLGTSQLGGNTGTMRTEDLPIISHSEQFRFSTNNTNPAWQVYAADIVLGATGYGGV